jgi:hypothetical protein
VRLKLEDAADGTHSVEAEVVASVVGWQTLTFNMANQAAGTAALNPAYTFNKASVFMNFNTAGTGETYYMDDLIYLGASGTGTGTGTGTSSGGSPVIASAFNSAMTTTNGGTWANYAGGANSPPSGSGGGFADAAVSPSYIYEYINGTTAQLAGYTYQGITFTAPGTFASATGKTALSYGMGVNPEWFNAAGGAKFVVILAGRVSGVSNASCDPKVAAVVQASSSGSVTYATPLSAFNTVVQNCAVGTLTASQILASPIVSVDFQADGGGAAITASGLTSNINTTVPDGSGTSFPTTISVAAPVQFQ